MTAPRCIPTLAQIQQLFPLGVVELDAVAQREVRAVFAFRDVFTTLVDPAATEGLSETFRGIYAKCSEEARPDPSVKTEGAPAITAIHFHRAVMEVFTTRMLEADSQADATGLMNYDLLDTMEKQAGEVTHQRAGLYSHSFGAVLASMQTPAIPIPMIQCVVYAVIHALFSRIVISCLYRRNPEIRFPLHRLITLNIDVPDEATALQATITGYQVPLIMSMQPKGLPDVIDSSMFEKKEEKGWGKLMGGPGMKKPVDPPEQTQGQP